MLRVIHEKRFLGFCPGIKGGWQDLMRAFEELRKGQVVHYDPAWSPPQTRSFIDTLHKEGKLLAAVADRRSGPLYVCPYGAPGDWQVDGRQVVDATCSNVRLAQESVRELSESGLPVVIAGEDGDWEPKMLQTWAQGCSYVVSEPAEVWDLPLVAGAKVALASQTSFRPDTFGRIREQLEGMGHEVVVGSTGCRQIASRVQAALQLALSCQYVAIVATDSYSSQLHYLVARLLEQHLRQGSAIPVVAYGPENIGADTFGGLQHDTVVALVSTTVVDDRVVANVFKRLESLGSNDIAEKPIHGFRPCHGCPDQIAGCEQSCRLVLE